MGEILLTFRLKAAPRLLAPEPGKPTTLLAREFVAIPVSVPADFRREPSVMP
jgi:hypothetical protein